jgi:hypothetical protein
MLKHPVTTLFFGISSLIIDYGLNKLNNLKVTGHYHLYLRIWCAFYVEKDACL